MASVFDALTSESDLSNKLEAYFATITVRRDLAQTFGLLAAQSVLQKTLEFRSFHSLVRGLEGIVLDDPGTSDHHVILCVSAVRGAVLYLSHDGTTRIVFKDLDSFWEAINRAADKDEFVEDEHPTMAWVAQDQAGLQGLISKLRSDPAYEEIGPALVPSLSLEDTDFLMGLVDQNSVYIPEAVCREVEARPAAHLLPLIERAEAHPHWMVRNAAIRARVKIDSSTNV